MNQNCLDSLPDDALLAIGSWVAATGIENFARFLKANRRCRNVLGQPSLLAELIRERTDNDNPGIETLEQLALWESVKQVGLWDENRLGFDYASIEISPDVPQHADDEDILYSRQRITKVGRILKRFPDCHLRIEAHCGTGAPVGIAERFSVARGMSVVRSFLEIMSAEMGQDDDEDEYYHPRDLAIAERRLRMTSWGRQISEAAEASQHRYGSLARLGKGWVERYVCHGDELEMPRRPDFYEGQTRTVDEESDDDGNVVIYMRLDGDYDEDDSSEEMEDEEVGPVDDMGAIEHYEDSEDED